MSAPSALTSPLGALYQSSPPDQSRPSVMRSSSLHTNPRSQYLRNAIQARRAQNTPLSPLRVQTPPPPFKVLEVSVPTTAPDAFDEFALTDEHTAPVSPIRRRRPSDVGLPRSKTVRELSDETEKLRETLMTANMRVELLKKSNSDLQQTLKKERERMEEFEKIEQETLELKAENNNIRRMTEAQEDEIAQLRAYIDQLQNNNAELADLAQDTVTQWKDQELAFDEAVECIVKAEEERTTLEENNNMLVEKNNMLVEKNGLLLTELRTLTERVTALEDNSRVNTLIDSGLDRGLSQTYIIESRPSTSHFDSDYYSQPGSPHISPSKASITSIERSERSKKFLEHNDHRKESASKIVQRMSSVASLTVPSIRPSCPAPQNPQVPWEHQQRFARIVEEEFPRASPKTPARYRHGRPLPPQPLQEEDSISAERSGVLIPQSPSPQPSSMRRSTRTILSKASNDSNHSSGYVASPASTTTFRRRQAAVVASISPAACSTNSRHKHTTSPRIPHQSHVPLYRRQSESDMIISCDFHEHTSEPGADEWMAMTPQPSLSVLSERDLTTEVDPYEDRDEWWRGVDRLTFSDVIIQTQQGVLNVPQTEPHLTHDGYPSHSRQDEIGPIVRSSLSVEFMKTPSLPTSNNFNMERDFFFNGAEDEDLFIQKARVRMGSPWKQR